MTVLQKTHCKAHGQVSLLRAMRARLSTCRELGMNLAALQRSLTKGKLLDTAENKQIL